MDLKNVIFVGPFLRTHRVQAMNRKALVLRETGLVTSFLHLVIGQNVYNFRLVCIHTTVQKWGFTCYSQTFEPYYWLSLNFWTVVCIYGICHCNDHSFSFFRPDPPTSLALTGNTVRKKRLVAPALSLTLDKTSIDRSMKSDEFDASVLSPSPDDDLELDINLEALETPSDSESCNFPDSMHDLEWEGIKLLILMLIKVVLFVVSFGITCWSMGQGNLALVYH